MATPSRQLLDHPIEILEKILSFCTYDEIARLRLVNKSFDRMCQSLLNKGFIAVDRYHAQCLRNVKSQLPRRESERRNHPLARHCDILTAIETRLSLLGMTFMKYVDTNLCCFIPGKVIDEIYRVLRYIGHTPSPPRAHEILQELRDISSMAMEHFDEKIVPTIKQKMLTSPTRLTIAPQGTFSLPGPSAMFSGPPRPMPIPRGVRQDLFKLQQTNKQTTISMLALKKDVLEYKTKLVEQKKKAQEHEKLIQEQNRILTQQNAKLSEQETKINDVNRKLLEYDQKFADMMAELVRCREESNSQHEHTTNSPRNVSERILTATTRWKVDKTAADDDDIISDSNYPLEKGPIVKLAIEKLPESTIMVDDATQPRVCEDLQVKIQGLSSVVKRGLEDDEDESSSGRQQKLKKRKRRKLQK